MATSDKTLRLIFTGQDDSGRAVKSVTASLRELKQAVREGKSDITDEKRAFDDSVKVLGQRRREERLLRNEFRESNQSIVRATGVINSVGNAALKVNSIFTAHNVLQRRVQEQNRDTGESYKFLQEQITLHGANSKQAQDALRGYNNEVQKSKDLANEANVQYLNMGLSVASLSDDVFRLVERVKLASASRAVNQGDDLIDEAILAGAAASGFRGKLTGAGQRLGLVTHSVKDATGVKGPQLTNLGKGLGIAGGAALVTSGVLSSQALSEERKSNEERILSVLQSAGGGALTGAMLGTLGGPLAIITAPVGAAIGGAAGAGVGLATNYAEEFTNLFAGKGFVSNADRDAGVGMHIENVNIYTNEIANPDQLKALLEAEANNYG